MPDRQADEKVEIYTDGAAVGSGHPLPVSPVAGGAGGLTDTELRATPVKVDDDGTQAILTAQLDIALSALRDALRGASSRTLTDLYGILDGLEGSVDGLEALLAGGLPAALTSEGGLKVTLVPSAAAGGSSIYRNLDVGTTGVRIKSGAGQVYGWYIYNNAATVRFVKLYDSNTNPPTQADTPALTIPVPAGSGANVAFPNGIAFASGIGIRASTGVADNDTGAPSTNDVIVNLLYK